jgi:hypothetical protein
LYLIIAELGENLALHLSLRVFAIFLAQIWPLLPSFTVTKKHLS